MNKQSSLRFDLENFWNKPAARFILLRLLKTCQGQSFVSLRFDIVDIPNIDPIFKTVTIRSNNYTAGALSKYPDNFVYECSWDKSQEQTDGVEDAVTD